VVRRCFRVLTTLIAISGNAKGNTAQFCWAFGAFDNTVYYARAEDREDRKASFISLLEISAIDTVTAECLTEEVRLASDSQLLMTAEWRKAKFELVDTTLLSDLDF